MTIVLMMQMTINNIVDVITMGHRLVATTRSMHVVCIVTATSMTARAGIWVCIVHLQHMLIDVIIMHVV
jgi:hypothetical protein